MTMPTPESSPQILTQRSASFNRADIRQSARLRASRTDAGDVESTENLTCPKPSAQQHVRHPSLELHPSALHPINLNSKFDHLCSPASPAKAFAKVPIVSDDQADKESSFFCPPHTQGEDGTALQEELILEPHESLLQDTQQESCSTSLSGETKSPRDCSGFILWGNAAFRLSEARTAATGGTTARSQEGQGSEASNEIHVQDSKQSVTTNHMEGVLLSGDEGLFPSVDRLLSSDNTMEASHPTTISPVNTMEASIIAAPQGSVEHLSSVGSNLSGHKSLTFQHIQADHPEEPLKEELLMSAEAQSFCRGLDADKSEASDASDYTTPTEEMVDDGEKTPQETNTDEKDEVEMGKNSIDLAQSGCGSSSCSDMKDNPELALITAEEAKIRAELELEIERDLEREIKTKIYLLSRRLEELTVLKATRQPRQEVSKSNKEDTISSFVSSGQDDTATKVAALPKSPPPSKTSKNKPTSEHSRAEMVSKKHSVSGGEKDRDTPGYGNTPLTSWRKFATASGWAPHTKDGSSQVPSSSSSSDASFKNMKISKNSIDGALKPKVQTEKNTSSFKPDYQSWTGIASSKKKFDWMRTLRSEVVPNSPRFSSMKTNGEESSAFLPSSKETLCGNVARTLFTEDGVSTTKPSILRGGQRKESISAPRRSVLSSSKTPALHADMVAVTPRLPKDNVRSVSASRSTQSPSSGNQGSHGLLHKDDLRSASASRSTQKPSSGKNQGSHGLLHKDNLRSASASRFTQKPSSGKNQGSHDPMHRSPEPPQEAKVATTASKPAPLKASLQQSSSSKASGGVERKGSVGSVASINQMNMVMKNGSTQRSTSRMPTSRVSSTEIKHAPLMTTPSKQVCPPTSKSRAVPPIKGGTCTAQVGKVPPSINVARRQSSLPLKMTGGASRPAFY